MPTAVLIAADRGVVARLARLDAEFGLSWVDAGAADPADLVVIDLAVSHAIDEVAHARRRWPAAIIAGYLAVPDPELWTAGQRAGCDMVANRGALAVRLRGLLADAQRSPRLFPVLDEADVAGRLGLVGRVDDTPVGPVAIYQLDGSLYAAADRCPHAGAVLSDGALEHGILTCPRHGSQFDVCTGARTRGPSDTDIATFTVVITGGQVSILLPRDAGLGQ
ncbi:Rieske (2Fe-2S) protein [Gordonia rhizosphera]|uniref:Putative iron-sulfur protein n=1 Tax=Gordonia rhizosphera NBRC 16068 TaxID=1108045 RepID=K6VXV2_9ACTN|nr:Rieske 2Fe-2S domain-containing protein [Gordonia rhizosphera]GAB91735.1 putative iron-sulfur protein [Gordonia rhizosphera NBRC 16068]